MTQVATPPPTTPTYAEVVERFVALRDAKQAKEAEHKKEIARYDEALKRLERHLLAHLNTTGSDSVATPAGTFFRHTTLSVRVEDWDATLPFIQQNGLWNMLDRRVNKTAVREYMEAHDDLPPGLTAHREATVRVRRS